MIKCKDFREYNKVLRKYSRKMWKKYGGDFWVVWCSFVIDSPEKASDVLQRISCPKNPYHGSVNLKVILTEAKTLIGKTCYFPASGKKGILVGLELTNEDYYYMFKDSEGKIQWETCLSGIDQMPGMDN